MWRQFLLEPGIRAKTIFKATAINFAAPYRQGWNHQKRLLELDIWLEQSGIANFQIRLNEVWLPIRQVITRSWPGAFE
jgi:hypothetical protein